MPELWKPGADLLEHSGLTQYMQWLEREKGLVMKNYDQLWKWSVTDLNGFWGSFFEYAKIITHSPYKQVLKKPASGMIGAKWFDGASVNYAEHIFRHYNNEKPAILFRREDGTDVELSWHELKSKVAILAAWMKEQGVVKGDRVASLLPNVPEAVIAFLATQSIGAVWSSCSPDFGNPSIADRFVQIEPKILFVTDGYIYNGKAYTKIPSWMELRQQLPTLKRVVLLPYADMDAVMENVDHWEDLMNADDRELEFTPLPFDHPLWILYSSGTTGKPKAITHSVGGNLIEHLKVLLLHWDVKPGERFFWYSTTG